MVTTKFDVSKEKSLIKLKHVKETFYLQEN